MNNKTPIHLKDVIHLTTPFLTPLLIIFLSLTVQEWERNRQLLEKKKEFIQNLSKQLYGRHTRGSLVLSSIGRYDKPFIEGAKKEHKELRKELIKRKEQYDEAFFTWHKEYQANLFLLNEVLTKKDFQIYKDKAEEFSMKVFTDDKCITQLYDEKIHNKKATHTLRTCNAEHKKIKTCIGSYTHNMYQFIKLNENSYSKKPLDEIKKDCQLS